MLVYYTSDYYKSTSSILNLNMFMISLTESVGKSVIFTVLENVGKKCKSSLKVIQHFSCCIK